MTRLTISLLLCGLLAAGTVAQQAKDRLALVAAMRWKNPAVAVPALAPLLQDANEEVRLAAADGLARLGDDGVTALFAALTGRHEGGRDAARRELANYWNPLLPVKALTAALDSPNPEAHRLAALALAPARHPRTREVLAALLTAGTAEERRQVAYRLADAFHDRRAADVITADLAGEDGESISNAAIQLALLGEERGIDWILHCLRDGNAEARFYFAIEQYPRARLLEQLRPILAEKPGAAHFFLSPILLGSGDPALTEDALSAILNAKGLPVLLGRQRPDISTAEGQRLAALQDAFDLTRFADAPHLPTLLAAMGNDKPLERRLLAFRLIASASGEESLRIVCESLRNDPAAEIRLQAAYRLRDLNDVRFLEDFCAVLGDWDKRVRNVAADALHDLCDWRAADALYANGTQKSIYALTALGWIGDPRAKAPLTAIAKQGWPYALDSLARLDPGEEEVRLILELTRGAIRGYKNTLVRHRDDEVPAEEEDQFRRVLNGVSECWRLVTAPALRRQLCDFLVSMLDEPAAIAAIGQDILEEKEDPLATEALIARCRRKQDTTALYILTRYTGEQARQYVDDVRTKLPKFYRAMADGNSIVRPEDDMRTAEEIITSLRKGVMQDAEPTFAALRARLRANPDKARVLLPAILDLMTIPEGEERWYQVESVISLLADIPGDDARDALFVLLQNGLRCSDALKALAQRHDPQVIPYLHAMLADPANQGLFDTEIIETLVELRDPDIEQALLPLLDLGDTDQHLKALQVLAARGNARGVAECIRLLDNAEYRLDAIETLGQSGAKEAVELLIACLEKGSIEQRTAAATALRCLKDPRAREPLRRTLAHVGRPYRPVIEAALAMLPEP